MKTCAKIISAICVTAFLASCQTFSLVSNDKPVEIAGTYTVSPQISWSKAESDNTETWTQDGPLLQSLTFYKGVGDGEHVHPVGDNDSQKGPIFRKNMTLIEIKDLFLNLLKVRGGQNATVTKFSPSKFGTTDGFRMEFEWATENGVNMRGFLVGAVIKGELHAIRYAGTSIHYFEKYQRDAESVIGSIQLKT